MWWELAAFTRGSAWGGAGRHHLIQIVSGVPNPEGTGTLLLASCQGLHYGLSNTPVKNLSSLVIKTLNVFWNMLIAAGIVFVLQLTFLKNILRFVLK